MAHILVVDDIKDITDTVQMILEDAGHTVDIVNSAKDAKELLRTKQYNLMITDILMPEESGINLIDDVHKDTNINKPDKIIAISGGGPTMDPQVALGAASFKVDQQIKKPFTKDTLLTAVETLLSAQKTGT